METIFLTTDQSNDLYNYFDFEENEQIIFAELNCETKELKIHYLDKDEIEGIYIPSLDGEKYYEILKIFQKAEAINRMKSLKLLPNVIKEFETDNTVYYSERQNKIFDGILYLVKNKQVFVDIIKEFEDQRHALVYHAQLTRFNFGLCLSLLFISQYPEEWEMEQEDLKADSEGIMFPYSYVYNLDVPDFSDLGKIGIVAKNGGISRVY